MFRKTNKEVELGHVYANGPDKAKKSSLQIPKDGSSDLYFFGAHPDEKAENTTGINKIFSSKQIQESNPLPLAELKFSK